MTRAYIGFRCDTAFKRNSGGDASEAFICNIENMMYLIAVRILLERILFSLVVLHHTILA